MKPLYSFITALLLTVLTTGVYAQKNYMVVESGSASVIKQHKTVCMEWDYSNTQVVEFKHNGKDYSNAMPLDEYLKHRGDDFVRDWPSDHQYAESLFSSFFVKKISKKLNGLYFAGKSEYEQEGKDYKMLFHVDRLDWGNMNSFVNPMAMPKSGGAIFDGSIEIINLSTGETECVLRGLVKGTGQLQDRSRLAFAYMTIVDEIKAVIKK